MTWALAITLIIAFLVIGFIAWVAINVACNNK